ncbi:MAG: molybdopterin-guanine dinucleotide biosynthesis protein B [Candidatus Neomarinimicrobiota bacterium]
MQTLADLLEEAAEAHGHLCPGQILGVRMAMLGCREVAIDEPKGSKDLIVYVEIDRCATDAIQSVTGCKLGKRTLKYLDYGKMAATFLNQASGRAVRVQARDDAREAVWRYAAPAASNKEAQLQAYMVMSDEELFVATAVQLHVPEEDLPGHPVSRKICERCGEGINDRREVKRTGGTLCRAYAFGSYYQVITSGNSQRRQGGSSVTPPVIAIVGPSGSGKTRVATTLIRMLVDRGYRIAAVKHAAHGHQVDRAGTDSVRLFQAGAGRVVVSSPGQVTAIEQTRGETRLEDIVASLDSSYELVVAEGFKNSAVAKVLVLAPEMPSPSPENVIAVVGDCGGAENVPCYTFQELDGLASQIQEQIMGSQPPLIQGDGVNAGCSQAAVR